MVSSDPLGEVSASTRNSCGALSESSVERQTVREIGRVSDRVHTRQPHSPGPTPESPARENPIAVPRTGTTRSEPSAPASVGASSRHNEAVTPPASACLAQRPHKAEGASPRGGERHHGVREANWSTESDQTERGAAHHAGLRGTPERHAAGHHQGTRTGAKQHQLRSRQRCAHPATNLAPAGYGTAAVRMDECARGGYPAPAGYETAAVRMDECVLGG